MEVLAKWVDTFLKKAERSLLAEVNNNKQAKTRIQLGLKRRLKPYALEAEIIAYQILQSDYLLFQKEIGSFLNAVVHVVACPDGRISSLSLADPKVANVHRLPGGDCLADYQPAKINCRYRIIPVCGPIFGTV